MADMDEGQPEFEGDDETEEEVHLARLEKQMLEGTPWSREDQEWVVAQLQSAWQEAEDWKNAQGEDAADRLEES